MSDAGKREYSIKPHVIGLCIGRDVSKLAVGLVISEYCRLFSLCLNLFSHSFLLLPFFDFLYCISYLFLFFFWFLLNLPLQMQSFPVADDSGYSLLKIMFLFYRQLWNHEQQHERQLYWFISLQHGRHSDCDGQAQ